MMMMIAVSLLDDDGVCMAGKFAIMILQILQ